MAKKRWGDRRDGRKLRDLDGLHVIMMHLMPKRTEAEVYLEYQVDVTELLKFIDAKNLAHPEYKTTMFHCLVAAGARTVKERPYLNRFICGRHLYERDEISLSFTAKRKFEDHAEESLMQIFANDDTTLDSITRRVVGDVTKMREETSASGLDNIINIFAKLPKPLLAAVFGTVRFLSSIGHVPKALTEGDTNHTSILFSNLGSIKCNCCYHHLNNYGTNSLMITVGVIHKEPKVMADGSIQVRDVMNLGCTADERIADGFYFARSLRLIDYLLNHPQLLDVPLKEEIEYEC